MEIAQDFTKLIVFNCSQS